MAGGSVTEGTAEREKERKKMGGNKKDMVATGNITVFF